VGLLALAVAAGLTFLPDQVERRGAARLPTCPVPGLAPAGPAAPPRSPGPPPAVAPQPGFTWYVDPSGFRITLPDGWQAQHIGSAVCFRPPGGSGTLAVDQWQPAGLNLVAYWEERERELTGTAGYSRLQLEVVGNFQRAAADWQFTYKDRNGDTIHVIARAMVFPTGPAYSVYWSVPEVNWGAEPLAQFAIMSGSGFRPAP
jgi:hypothetical protein